jgi:hypothetical protein
LSINVIFAGDTAALWGDIEEFVTGDRATAASQDLDVAGAKADLRGARCLNRGTRAEPPRGRTIINYAKSS